MEDHHTAIATIGQELYKTEMTIGRHVLVADEPSEVGGKDLGPRPGDFILMSLASCTAITLRMYANRKNLDVQQIRVTVYNEGGATKTVLKSKIEFQGTLTEDQRARMMQIAKLCPTHKMLTRPIEIETDLLIENP